MILRGINSSKLILEDVAALFTRKWQSAFWRDIIWQASGNSLAQVIGILSMPLLTRLYTPQNFATLNLFLQVSGFLAIITWRYEYFIQLPKEDADANTLLHVVITLGTLGVLLLTFIMLIFKETFARWLGDPALANGLVLAPITGVLLSFSLAVQHRTQRRQNYRKSGLAELINKGGYVVSGVIGYRLLPGAIGLLAASPLSTLGKLIWLAGSWRRQKPHMGSGSTAHHAYTWTQFIEKLTKMKAIMHDYMRMSSSLVFAHIMLVLTTGIPTVFITRMYGSKTLGQFALVILTLYLPSGFIGNAIGQVYYQRAANQWANSKKFSNLWFSTAKNLLLLGVPIYTSIMLIAPWAYPFIFGRAWQEAGLFAVYMAISAFFSFITSPLDRTFLVVNAWWYAPLWHALRAASTGLVAWLAWVNHWDFQTFLMALVTQMSVIYLIDYWAGWRFASSQPIQYREG